MKGVIGDAFLQTRVSYDTHRLPTRVSYDELKKREDRIYPYIYHIYTCFIHSLHHKFTGFIHCIHYKVSPNLLNSYKSIIILCRNENKKTYHSMPISAQRNPIPISSPTALTYRNI